MPDVVEAIIHGWTLQETPALCLNCEHVHKLPRGADCVRTPKKPKDRPYGVYVAGVPAVAPATASLDTPATSVEKPADGVGTEETSDDPAPCGSYRIMGCNGCLTAYAVRVACNRRFRCVECAKRLRNKLVRLYGDFFAAMPHASMLTLTLKNCPDVRAAKKRLVQCFRKLRQRKYWRFNRDGSERNLYGGWRIEVTIDAAGLYHVHAHVLVNAPYLDQCRLADEWEKVTGDSRIIDIRRINGRKGILEVLKYVAKPWELTEDQIDALEAGLSGERMFQFFGKTRPEVQEVEHKLNCPKCGERMEEWATCATDPRVDPEFARLYPRVQWVKD